jgi:uncharacterized protein YjbI with pentapeptide repeats
MSDELRGVLIGGLLTGCFGLLITLVTSCLSLLTIWFKNRLERKQREQQRGEDLLEGARKQMFEGRILRSEIEAWIEYAKNKGHTIDLYKAKLQGANMRGLDLSKARMGGAQLPEADLRKAILIGTKLQEANLREAVLKGANLGDSETDLGKAILTGANLIDADLHEANLFKAKLDGANLTGAELNQAYLSEVDLSNAKVTIEQLAQAQSLAGATLCDGTQLSQDNWKAELEQWRGQNL